MLTSGNVIAKLNKIHPGEEIEKVEIDWLKSNDQYPILAVSDLAADIRNIQKAFKCSCGFKVIQNGNIITKRKNFDLKSEAILLQEVHSGYIAYLYINK